MAQTPGQKASKTPPADRAVHAVGRVCGFTIVAGVAFGLLATVVLLPHWSRLDRVRADRDTLATRTHTYEQLIEYKGQLIDSIKTDPLQTERLLMQQQNFHRPGETALTIADAPVDPPAIDALTAQAPPVKPPSEKLASLSRRVQRPATRRGLLLLSGIMMILAVLMFLPPTSGAGKTTKGKKAA